MSAPDPEAVPRRGIAVVACMDARIDALAVLDLRVGDAHVLRNAGGRVTDDVLRSLTLSVHVFGVERVLVVHHTGCGLAGTTDEELRARTGSSRSFLPIADHEEALRDDVDRVLAEPALARLRRVDGLLHDLAAGSVDEVLRREPG